LWALALKGCPLKRGGGGIKKKIVRKVLLKGKKRKEIKKQNFKKEV